LQSAIHTRVSAPLRNLVAAPRWHRCRTRLIVRDLVLPIAHKLLLHATMQMVALPKSSKRAVMILLLRCFVMTLMPSLFYIVSVKAIPKMRVMNLTRVLAIALFMQTMSVHAIEEPAYEVTAKLGDVEVRRYAAYVVAEIVLPGPAKETGNKAFRILAGYIFGKNKGEKKLSMTAPVTQAAAPMRLEQTAPVIQSAAPGAFLVQFVLPKGVTLATAPEPVDPRIVLRQEPAKRVAVIRYSGVWSDANYNRHLTQLQETLRTAGVTWSGAPIYSRYNSPFTPWFLRRNEIWLQLPAGSDAEPD
jgi:SOUL heme-binding protein